MEFLLPLLVFVAVFAAVLAAGRRGPSPVARLARHDVALAGSAAATAPAPKPALRLPRPDFGRLSRWVVNASRGEVRAKSAQLLLQAGSAMPVGTFLLLRAGFMLGLAPAIALFALRGFGLTPLGLGIAGFALLAVPRLPAIRFKRQAKQRALAIERALPDALDLLVVCVEGGLSLDGALLQVATRTEGVLADELRRLQRDLAAGMGRRDAFLALAARSQSESLSIVSSTIVQADKMGMSVASTLRTLAETMRTRRRQEAEERARKAPVKMMPFLIGFMIPSLFVVILGPAAISIMELF